MNELRWILLGLGLILIGIIYITSRRGSVDRDAEEMMQEPRLEPTGAGHESADRSSSDSNPPVDDQRAPLLIQPVAQDMSIGAEETSEQRLGNTVSAEPDTINMQPIPGIQPAPAPVVMEKVVALHLVPRAGTLFAGVEFINALKAEGLKYDRFDIFHRFQKGDEITNSTPSLFSVANIIKPGTFNMRGLERQEFKGASMFLVLPGPEDAVGAFMDMVATGRRLAATLEGQLLDSDGTHLSRQRASHLREEIVNYQHGLVVPDGEMT